MFWLIAMIFQVFKPTDAPCLIVCDIHAIYILYRVFEY